MVKVEMGVRKSDGTESEMRNCVLWSRCLVLTAIINVWSVGRLAFINQAFFDIISTIVAPPNRYQTNNYQRFDTINRQTDRM